MDTWDPYANLVRAHLQPPTPRSCSIGSTSWATGRGRGHRAQTGDGALSPPATGPWPDPSTCSCRHTNRRGHGGLWQSWSASCAATDSSLSWLHERWLSLPDPTIALTSSTITVLARTYAGIPVWLSRSYAATCGPLQPRGHPPRGFGPAHRARFHRGGQGGRRAPSHWRSDCAGLCFAGCAWFEFPTARRGAAGQAPATAVSTAVLASPPGCWRVTGGGFGPRG
jgi:hypothetical protein